MKYIGFLSLLLTINTVFSQSYFSSQFQYGKIVSISPSYPPILHNAKAYQLLFEKKTSGKSHWHSLYHYPSICWAAGIWDLGNDEVLGNSLVIQPIFKQTIFHEKNFTLDYNVSTSLAYFTKIFSFSQNPQNTAVGSHLSSTSNIGVSITHTILQKWAYTAGIGLSHFSNGNTSSPNLGINIPAASLAISYKIAERQAIPIIKDSLPIISKKIYPAIKIAYGFSEALTPNGPKYPFYSGSFFLNKNLSHWFRLRMGSELFYSQKAKEAMYDLQVNTKTLQNSTWGLAVFAGGELLIGHLSLVMQGGPNILQPFQMKYRIYSKIGLQYYPFDTQLRPRKQIYAGVYVHAHSGEADFTEFGIGYIF